MALKSSFDPSKPTVPVSFPISELADLESGAYFRSFHYPFNRASVPLPESAAGRLPDRRRLLVCHDMMGGYADDRWVQGGGNDGAYAIWHWYLMDVFVYFSHELVTIPPPCWTNAAHTHGVKVLGTFIAEYEKGAELCRTLLATKESVRMYAEKLAELAFALGFDGWLLNMEVTLNAEQVANLEEFVSYLTQVMHSEVPGSLIIWYDSVTIDGHLDWQDQLNEKNKPFFDLCDGIFVNYTWKENNPTRSAAFAGSRRYDVYMGIDVYGRGTYGGGQWNAIRHDTTHFGAIQSYVGAMLELWTCRYIKDITGPWLVVLEMIANRRLEVDMKIEAKADQTQIWNSGPASILLKFAVIRDFSGFF